MAEVDTIINEPSEVEKRIKELSGKAKTAYEERDAEKVAREAAEAKAAEAQRSADFYSQFSDVVASNPAAKEHKDEILAKVKAGYTTEDAMFAVLGKAGKLNQPKVDTKATAGGSATNAITGGGGQKKVSEMTRDEKRAALLEAESKGDLALT